MAGQITRKKNTHPFQPLRAEQEEMDWPQQPRRHGRHEPGGTLHVDPGVQGGLPESSVTGPGLGQAAEWGGCGGGGAPSQAASHLGRARRLRPGHRRDRPPTLPRRARPAPRPHAPLA